MATTSKPKSEKPRAASCSKTGKLRKTQCCGNWVCDDHDKYVPFSYAQKQLQPGIMTTIPSAGIITMKGMEATGKTARNAATYFETEMYVWYGTNDYNFEKLETRPSSNRLTALSVGRSFVWATKVSPCVGKNTNVVNAPRRRCVGTLPRSKNKNRRELKEAAPLLYAERFAVYHSKSPLCHFGRLSIVIQSRPSR